MGPPHPTTSDIVEIVLGASASERSGRLAIAGVVALAAHVALLLCVRDLASHAAARPATVDPSQDYELDVRELQAPIPPAPPPEEPVVERRAAAPRIRAALARPTPAPEAARAASVVAQDPDSNAPVDLTGDTVVTGTATTYAGGVTTSAATSASPGRGGSAAADGNDAIRAIATDRASSVSLESEKWSCPWPREADAEQIDEQTVILRVVVDASGSADSATVLADPGHGFGAAAVACALRTRFVPARARDGAAVRSTSPPIRVRFTR